VARLTSTDEGADWKAVKGIVAAFAFIFTNAAKHNAESETLIMELQQLGMPKEHSDRLAKPYTDYVEHVRTALAEKRLALPHLVGVDWQVDFVLSSDALLELNEPSVQLRLQLDDDRAAAGHIFSLSADKLRALLAELKTARSFMSAEAL
jgi:COMMD2-7/10, HN domain/COMM domain